MFHYDEGLSFGDKAFETEAEMLAYIQVDHPELGDDAFVEFVENHTWED